MQTSITFKNLDPSENLKTYVKDKLKRIDKFLDNPAEANVVLSVEKFRHIAEVNISGDRLIINSKDETNDMYSAIDIVLDKLEAQIKKNKQKLRKRRGNSNIRTNSAFNEQTVSADDEDAKIIIENIEYKPMDIEEAVMQMDLVNDNFFVFTDAKTGKVNVLYRHKDGNYGLIQPSG